MLVEIAAQLPPQQGGRELFFEIVGKKQAGGVLTTQVPEEPLFGDTFRNVPERACLRSGERSARFVAMATTPLPFRLGSSALKRCFIRLKKPAGASSTGSSGSSGTSQ